MTTDSGSVVPEKPMPMPIENARPMPGAMYVIDWNTTSQSPIDPLRSLTSGVTRSLQHSHKRFPPEECV